MNSYSIETPYNTQASGFSNFYVRPHCRFA